MLHPWTRVRQHSNSAYGTGLEGLQHVSTGTSKTPTCVDCVKDGITTVRPTPHGGPRTPLCVSHHRARRSATRGRARASRLAKVYGITQEQYDALYEAQGGRCNGCQRANGKSKALAVDHAHTEGFVRQLLCGPCNFGVLGHLRDDPAALRRLADSIENPPAFAVIGRVVVPDHEEIK